MSKSDAHAAVEPFSLHVLASGSRGNASIVECAGRSILIDCGICKRDFFQRADDLGIDVSSIDAVLITHEHTDHTKGLGVVLRGLAKEGIRPIVFASDAVQRASRELGGLQDSCDMRSLKAGDAISVGAAMVHPFHTSHDAAESFGFRFESSDDALGFMTDTGIVLPEAHEALCDVRILGLESNHDLVMLHEGSYPYSVKQRIEGDLGHLSNDQSASELAELLSDRLQQVVALHVSENNNTFGIPVRTMEALLQREGHDAQVNAGLPRTPITVR